MARPVYILDAIRTPIGKTLKSLKNFQAAQLGAVAIEGLLARTGDLHKDIDQVVLGNTVSAGGGQNIARRAAVMAGLSQNVPAFTVNNVCGAGPQAVLIAAQAIEGGHARAVIAGGAESSSSNPYLVSRKEKDDPSSKPIDSLIYDGLTCQITGKLMGELAEDMAKEFQITRAAQEEFSSQSQQRALQAKQEGKFKNEIIPIHLDNGKVFNEDERIRKKISLEHLRELPSVFCEGGTLTAGTSCAPSDGACAIALAGETTTKNLGLVPQARIIAAANVAVAPRDLYKAGVDSIKQCLAKAEAEIDDIDLFEISEAFAVQVIYTRDTLQIPNEKINIWGGDIALGHPLGAAGARILVTLTHALRDQNKKRGLACVCFGGGGSISILIENESSKGKI